MKSLTHLHLTRHLSTTTTTTATFTLLPKTPSTPTVKSHIYPRSNPHSTRSLSLTAALSDGASPSRNLPNYPSLLSLSSNDFSHFLSLSSNPTSRPSDDNLFTWHRSSDAAANGCSSAGRSDPHTAAVVLGWLGATQRHLRRYAELYTARGIDAVTFVVPVMDAMTGGLGRKVEQRIAMLAEEILAWLVNNGGRERSLVFHTFSTTGWLVYGSILAHFQRRPELLERIKGCIVDSGGDPELNPKVWAAGFTAALVKKRNSSVSSSARALEPGCEKNTSKSQQGDRLITEVALLFALEKMFTFIFKLPDVNQRLSRIISLLSDNQPPCPQLYLYSTADEVIPYRSVESFIEHQKLRGRNVLSHNFGCSPHVDHYRTFSHVYSSLVNNFINEISVAGKLA